MKTRNLILMAAAIALLAIVMGCSSGEKQEAAATPPAADTATQVAQTHDCDGGCGMKDVPMDQLTEIDGKFYCQGCASHMKAAGEDKAETKSADGHG